MSFSQLPVPCISRIAGPFSPRPVDDSDNGELPYVVCTPSSTRTARFCSTSSFLSWLDQERRLLGQIAAQKRRATRSPCLRRLAAQVGSTRQQLCAAYHQLDCIASIRSSNASAIRQDLFAQPMIRPFSIITTERVITAPAGPGRSSRQPTVGRA